jgi:uncharacterized protein (DUF736 family)
MKEFAIFKAKEKKNPKSPDYNVTVKINDKFLTIGGAWLRETKTGDKFFSCKLSDGYKDFKGFSITRDEEVSTLTEEEKAKIVALRTGNTVKEVVKEVVEEWNANNIPF